MNQREDTPRKRQRVSRACDFCHARGLRCRRGDSNINEHGGLSDCLTCIDYGVPCKVERPIRRRGRKPALPPLSEPINEHEHYPGSSAYNDRNSMESLDQEALNQTVDFRSLHFIQRLVRIYRDTMYQC
jgi:hypothetical protein